MLLPVITFLVFGSAQAQDNTPDAVEFKPTRLKFKVVLDRCSSKKIKATNKGSASIMDPVFSVQGSKEFRVDKGFQKCPNPLEPGQVCSVYIAFCPHTVGTPEAKLFFSGSETGVTLTGRVRQQGR